MVIYLPQNANEYRDETDELESLCTDYSVVTVDAPGHLWGQKVVSALAAARAAAPIIWKPFPGILKIQSCDSLIGD